MRYVVAAQRDARERVIRDWVARIESVAGLRIVGSPRNYRALVECETETVDALREALGSDWVIEPVISHRRS